MSVYTVLVQRGHRVAAVARNGLEYKLPEDVQILDVPRIRAVAGMVSPA